MLIVSITAQEILSRLYFVFTRCLKTSAGNMALSDFAEDSKKTNVVQTPVVKTQVSTVEDEILALEQIGANLIITKINEKSDKKVIFTVC
jgi:hypothetical protein